MILLQDCCSLIINNNNGDVVSRHNRVRDVFFESCRQAGIGGQMCALK